MTYDIKEKNKTSLASVFLANSSAQRKKQNQHSSKEIEVQIRQGNRILQSPWNRLRSTPSKSWNRKMLSLKLL